MESSAVLAAAGLGLRGWLGPRGCFIGGRRAWAPSSRLPSLPRLQRDFSADLQVLAEGLQDVALCCETPAALRPQPQHHIKGSVV